MSIEKSISDLCHTLRLMGCAVCVFTPEELGDVDPSLVEDQMCSHGWNVIEQWKTEELK